MGKADMTKCEPFVLAAHEALTPVMANLYDAWESADAPTREAELARLIKLGEKLSSTMEAFLNAAENTPVWYAADADVHECTVVCRRTRGGVRLDYWTARCVCGWVGDARATEAAALRDGDEHRAAM